jgi:hypothetical protein
VGDEVAGTAGEDIDVEDAVHGRRQTKKEKADPSSTLA